MSTDTWLDQIALNSIYLLILSFVTPKTFFHMNTSGHIIGEE